jgi:Flp pilus assembly protein TadB
MLEFVQDIDGGLSSKRLMAFTLGLLIMLVYICVLFGGMPLTEQGERLVTGAVDLLKWIVGFIATEQATKFARRFTNADEPKSDRI